MSIILNKFCMKRKELALRQLIYNVTAANYGMNRNFAKEAKD